MLAEELEFVIGVDTHKHSHGAAVLSKIGGVIASAEIDAKESGYRYLIRIAAAPREAAERGRLRVRAAAVPLSPSTFGSAVSG